MARFESFYRPAEVIEREKNEYLRFMLVWGAELKYLLEDKDFVSSIKAFNVRIEEEDEESVRLGCFSRFFRKKTYKKQSLYELLIFSDEFFHPEDLCPEDVRVFSFDTEEELQKYTQRLQQLVGFFAQSR